MLALSSGFDTLVPVFAACSLNIRNDAEWLEVNLGPFSKEVDYSEFKELNITGVRESPFSTFQFSLLNQVSE